jgi:hypothetical protein
VWSVLENTLVLWKFWILNNILHQLSCLDNFSLEPQKIMWQWQYVTVCVSSVAANWFHTHVVTGLNPGQAGIFFIHAATMLSFYSIQRISITKFCTFWKSVTMYHCMVLLQVALVLIPPYKYVRPPCWYY